MESDRVFAPMSSAEQIAAAAEAWQVAASDPNRSPRTEMLWSIRDSDILYDARGRRLRAIMYHLLARANGAGMARPTHAELAMVAGASISQIKVDISSLRDEYGLVRWTTRRGRPRNGAEKKASEYWLVLQKNSQWGEEKNSQWTGYQEQQRLKGLKKEPDGSLRVPFKKNIVADGIAAVRSENQSGEGERLEAVGETAAVDPGVTDSSGVEAHSPLGDGFGSNGILPRRFRSSEEYKKARAEMVQRLLAAEQVEEQELVRRLMQQAGMGDLTAEEIVDECIRDGVLRAENGHVWWKEPA